LAVDRRTPVLSLSFFQVSGVVEVRQAEPPDLFGTLPLWGDVGLG